MKKVLAFLCAAVLLSTSARALDVDAPSALLMEKETGTVLFAKDEHARLEPASVTKIMTLLLGIKFLVRPVMTTRQAMTSVSAGRRAAQSILCGMMIGFICGFVGAGGIGQLLNDATSQTNWDKVGAILVPLFVVVFVLQLFSNGLRRRIGK